MGADQVGPEVGPGYTEMAAVEARANGKPLADIMLNQLKKVLDHTISTFVSSFEEEAEKLGAKVRCQI